MQWQKIAAGGAVALLWFGVLRYFDFTPRCVFLFFV
jgi:hypothetical protein